MSRKGFTTFNLASLAAFALAVASQGWAQLQVVEAQATDGQRLKVIGPQNIIISEVKDGESHTVEIRVVDGKATVIRDGKELPNAQVIESDEDGVIITDESGKKLHELKLRLKGDGRGLYFFGDADFHGFNVKDHEGLMQWIGKLEGAKPKVMLGVNMSPPGPALEKHLHLEPGTCTMLSGVYEGLPAHGAGLGEFDIIVKVDGQTPADNETIRKILAEREAGDTIRFTVIQEGKHRDVTVELKAYDAKAMSKATLLGNAANQYQYWTAEGVPHLSYYSGQLPRVFFAPEQFRTEMENVAPRMELLRQGQGEPHDIEEQLQRLDGRMAELEKLLQKLIERRDSNR